MSFSRRLEDALGGKLPYGLSDAAIARLERLELHLRRFGRAVDVSGFHEPEILLRRYFAEPLAALPWLPPSGNAWDLGSGGGSPALPLAIARSSVHFRLLEPAKKKALFLEEVARELGLSRLRVLRARWQSASLEDALAVTSRGLRLTETDAERIVAAIVPGGRFLWFSGERRLREAGRHLGARPDLRVDGPLRLVPEGGWILVVEKLPGPRGPVPPMAQG